MKQRIWSAVLVLCLLASLLPGMNLAVFAAAEPTAISTVADLEAFRNAVNGGETYAGQTVTLEANLDVGELNWTPIGNSSYAFQGTFNGKGHIIYNFTINTSDRYCGLFGKIANATISNLGLENATVVSSTTDVAALAGNAKGGLIERCWVSGSVTGNAGVGGILGSTHSSAYPTTIQNCYSRVALTGTGTRKDIAGISGWNGGTSVKIENCLSACTGEVRPIAGWSDGSAVQNEQITNTYFDMTLSPDFSSESGRTDLGRTSDDLKAKATYEGWDFDAIWAIDPGVNGGYPYLRGFTPGIVGAPSSISVIVEDTNGGRVEDAAVYITNSSTNMIILNHQGNGIYSNTVDTENETYDVYVNAVKKDSFTQNGSGAVTVTVTVDVRMLSSIAVQTPPAKTTYIAGECFVPAGLVITLTYNNGSAEDVAYAGNENSFTFAPSTSTPLTTANTNVAITYGGKTANQVISISAGDEKGIFAGRYSYRQVFDCQRSPEQPQEGKQFTVSRFDKPMNAVASTAGSSRVRFIESDIKDKVFYFKKTGNAQAPFSLYMADDASGTTETKVSVQGNIYGLGAKGFLYISGDDGSGKNLGYFISNEEGYNYNDGFTYTPDITGPITEKEAEDYDAANMTPQEKVLTGIEIKTEPTKTKYKEGNNFEPTGLVLTLIYDNDPLNTKEVAYNLENAKDFIFNPALSQSLSATNTVVIIEYAGKTASQDISVNAKTLSSIAVKTEPAKKVYIEGNKFDPAGLVIELIYDNGTKEDVAYAGNESSFAFVPSTSTALTTANDNVVITYGGKTASQDVSVNAKTLSSIAVKTEPTKKVYIEGNKFDPAGLVIELNYDNGTSEDVAYAGNESSFAFVPSTSTALTTANDNVVITYAGKTASQDITVNPKSEVSITDTPQIKNYDGNAQKFDIEGTALTGFTVEYKINGAYTETAPINAETYDVKITRAEDAEYKAYKKVITGGLVIAKATPPAIIFPTASTITYGAALSASTLTGGSGDGTFAWTNGATVPTVTNRGYEVTFTPRDTNNYDYTGVALTKAVAITVNKANPAYTAPTGLTATYGDTLSSVNLPTGWTWANSTQSVGDAGSNTFKTTFTPTDTANYNPVTNISVIVSVTPRPVNIVWNGTENLVYDGTVKIISASVENLVSGDTAPLMLGGTFEATEKGSYTATVTAVDNSNYTLAGGTNLEKNWSIAETENEWTEGLAITGWTYGENANAPQAAAKHGTVVFSYSDSENGTYTENIPQNAGTYWVKATVSGTESYAEISAKKEFVIAKETPVIAEAPKAARVRRGSALSTSAISGGVVKGLNDTVLEGTFAWKDDAETMSEIGEFTKTAVFIPTDENYAAIEADITVTVYRPSSGGSSVTRYTVTFDTQGGSKITSSSVTRNTVVKEPAEPTKDGYVFEGWFTDKACATEYDFTSKVTKNITLYAKWAEDKKEPVDPAEPEEPTNPTEPTEPEEWKNPFTDVDKADWFYDAIKEAYTSRLMQGTTSTTFSPAGELTRGMFVTVLYRMEQELETNTSPFIDVSDDTYYAKAVAWGYANGIVKGISNTEYAPEMIITREQMAAMLYRYVSFKGEGPVGDWAIRLDYRDLESISDYAAEAVMFCTMKQLMAGDIEGTFAPQRSATRAEAAAVFVRVLNELKIHIK